MPDEFSEANRRHWDELVPFHLQSRYYDVDAFRTGASALRELEQRELGDVRGRSLLHLQCHFGLDSLSWARKGVIVTGADFSEPAIAAARELAEECGIDARFVVSDVYELPDKLDGAFDVVFASYGVVFWLPDVDRWAQVVAHFLRPGGIFYMVEFHPAAGVFDQKSVDDDLEVVYPYFTLERPLRFEEDGSYADRDAKLQNRVTYSWPHPVGDVVTALIDAGLRLDFLHEFPHTVEPFFPSCAKQPDGTYRLTNHDGSVPLLYSIRATKVGGRNRAQTAAEPPQMNEQTEANRRHWDEITPVHAASDFYDVASFKAGESKLKPVELEEMGDVRGKTLLHLQCHFGLDTLSWAREGATVTGVDFSERAIETARELAAECDIDARFVLSDISVLPNNLDGQFDVVFTSYGALCWLPNIARWAQVAAHFVRPGGTLYVVEFHPFAGVFDGDDGMPGLLIRYPYFPLEEPLRFDDLGTYTDRTAVFENRTTFEWPHPVSEVLTSLIDAGLRIEFLHEFPFSTYQFLPFTEQVAKDTVRLTSHDGSVPLLYSIKATKDE